MTELGVFTTASYGADMPTLIRFIDLEDLAIY